MNNQASFIQEIQQGYSPKGEYISLGKGKLNNVVIPEAAVNIPLKTMNRHGLIAGATGTGKTKTMQLIVEQLSDAGVPSLVMDVKGDLSGLAMPGDATNPKIIERYKLLDMQYKANGMPVEFLSLSEEKGVRLRATVTEFGPVLLSKILELNETQESVISVIFKFSDDHALPLIDLDDLKKVLMYVKDNPEGQEKLKAEYGSISGATVGAIQRKIIALEQQGADKFFGEPSFEVDDLLQVREGRGVISIVRLTDIQNKPALFSTFMLSLLAEIYATFPEVGDATKPKLCIFIDEAHLIFNEASKTLLNQIETVVKLIRSKGVGVYFVTQVPGDIPDGVLSQLGLKVQHALRGFTAKDRKEIKKAVENYPITQFYDADQLITQLGIGEAFITALNEKGTPTPLVHTYLETPQSRMDVLTETELNNLIAQSKLVTKYDQDINRDSAYEILTRRMEESAQQEVPEKAKPQATNTKKKQDKSFMEEVINSRMARDLGRTFTREITRSILGVLGIKKTRRR
uniref:helicase HerA-like domain-containing protein n=1 Tax=Ornithobacterium rhinotracheale TaxID=28251 RepID=UPI0039A765A4